MCSRHDLCPGRSRIFQFQKLPGLIGNYFAWKVLCGSTRSSKNLFSLQIILRMSPTATIQSQSNLLNGHLDPRSCLIISLRLWQNRSLSWNSTSRKQHWNNDHSDLVNDGTDVCHMLLNLLLPMETVIKWPYDYMNY